MAAAAEPLAYGQSEFELSGLTPVPGRVVRAPRVAESPAAFECRTVGLVRTNPGRPSGGNIVIGRVVHVYVRDGVVGERLHIDQGIGAIGRMGGRWYCTTRQRFEMPMGEARCGRRLCCPESGDSGARAGVTMGSVPSMEDILGPGACARAMGDRFERRDEQVRVAEAIDRAMEAAHLLGEAGTGVGKSFAYLAPSMVRCMERGEVVVIATNTIALQEQLVGKDIPLLRALLDPGAGERSCGVGAAPGAEPGEAARDGGDEGAGDSGGESGGGASGGVRPCLVKGRGNYLSIRRLRLASQRQDRLLADAASRRSLHVIEDWAYQTGDGTLSSLPPLERPGVWDRVQSDSGNCMGRKCPTHRQCFYQSARRAMERANLLVCNHALFFSDLALRMRGHGFLPRYDHVVIDEAHSAEEVASEHFGLSLSEGRVSHLLSTLYAPRQARGYLAHLALSVGSADEVDGTVRLVLEAEGACRAFFEAVGGLSDRLGEGGGRVRTPARIDNPLSPAMHELALRLGRLKASAKAEGR